MEVVSHDTIGRRGSERALFPQLDKGFQGDYNL
jgi:hypothetical protein